MPAVFNDPRLPANFWSKVELDPENDCWHWMANKDRDGYGRWQWLSRKDLGRMAHRISYSMLVGDIPEGMQIDHRCKTRDCVNPAHLEAVTLRENVDRSENYIAQNRAKTHCPKGHPLSGENLILKKQKGGVARICRTCRNEQALAAFHARKAVA